MYGESLRQGDGGEPVVVTTDESAAPASTPGGAARSPAGRGISARWRWVSLVAAIAGLIMLGASVAVRPSNPQQEIVLSLLPLFACLCSAWLPLIEVVTWVRTGEVGEGTVYFILAAGIGMMGQWSGAALLLCTWTIWAGLRARLYEYAARPLAAWEQLATGRLPGAAGAKAPEPAAEAVAGAGELAVVPERGVVPCDGVVVGESAVVSSTWHELPAVEKTSGDTVWAGDVNLGPAFTLQPVRRRDNTAMAQAAGLGRQALAQPAVGRLEQARRRWSLLCTMASLCIAVGAPLVVGVSTNSALGVALSVLALAVPGAWTAAVELPQLAAVGASMRKGIIPSSSRVMALVANLRSLALVWDTAMVRRRKRVTEVLPVKPKACTPGELLALAAAVEKAAGSEHPIAAAIQQAAREEGLQLPVAETGKVWPGRGVSAVVDGHPCVVGSAELLAARGIDLSPGARLVDRLQARDCQPVYCAAAGYLLGVLGLSETGKKDWTKMASGLRDLDVKIMVLGRSNEGRTVWMPGHPEGVVNLLSGQEVAALRSLAGRDGIVGIVGDAEQDGSLLQQADLSMALGPSGAVSRTVSILLMRSCSDVPWLIQRSRALRRHIVWAGIGAVASRLALAGLVVTGYANVVQVAVIDIAVCAVLAAATLRFCGREPFPMPYTYAEPQKKTRKAAGANRRDSSANWRRSKHASSV